jgi:2-C-methyl-D-erythritol 4-phosphate cytidylyltransferase
MSNAVILLSGGKGIRFGSQTPKQYLLLKDQPIVLYSFKQFLSSPHVHEIVVVAESEFQPLFINTTDKILTFAKPGARRQDSLMNGFNALKSKPELVAVHDSARPFINSTMIDQAFSEAKTFGSACLAMPVNFTVREVDSTLIGQKTLDRSKVFEIQTPQILSYALLEQGLKNALENHLEVTDDVALAEALGVKAKMVLGSRFNLKITTKEDLEIATAMIEIFS